MKIKELIKILEYELNSTGNSEVLISINLKKLTVINNIVNTKIIATELEIPENKFFVKNYVM